MHKTFFFICIAIINWCKESIIITLIIKVQIMEARTEGRRGRGRPRKRYKDKTEDIARKTGKGIGEMKRMARNREDWKMWIEAVPTL